MPLCTGVALVSFVLWHQWPFETLRFENFLGAQSWLVAKGSLGPLRVLNFLALLVVTSVPTSKLSVVLEKLPLYRWLGWLGQEPLYVFAWSIVTSFLCYLLRSQWAALGRPAETAWVLLAVVSLWMAAAVGKVLREASKEGLRWASAVSEAVWAEAVGRIATIRRPISAVGRISVTGQDRLLLIASGTVWMCMQLVVATHAIDVEKLRGPLLILTWQLMYILGAVTGYRRCISAPNLVPKWRGLAPLCTGVALVSFVLWHQWPFETLRFENFASSGEFVGDLTGSAGRLTEESEKLTAGGIKGPLLLL